MFGFKGAPRGTDGDSVSPRRDKLIVAGLTLVLGAGLVVSTFRQGDRAARIRALQARVDQLNAKQAAARKRVEQVIEQYPGDPRVFELSNQAGWLTPEEWGEWHRLQIEIEELGGAASEDGSRHNRPTTGGARPHSEPPSDPTHPRLPPPAPEERG